jgi:3-hydroxyisobutyrate dehydrogenase-like beta-hydroxyacid dehydrogenase
MGQAIVRRLLAAGHPVVGWNRSQEKAASLVEAGMLAAATPREAARSADVVFSILTDAEALDQVLSGPDGVLAGLCPEAVFLDMSTIAPAASQGFAARVAEAGATMLDAPLSASVLTVEQGQASIMVGGDQEAFRRVRPVLEAIGPKLTYIGGNGQALQVKLAINLALVVQIVAFCEGVAMAEKAGVPRETTVDGYELPGNA